MSRGLARSLGAVALAVSALLLAAAAGSMPASGAPTVVIYDGESEAAALHVRATKESILPVPDALDTFLPLARTRIASPDSRFALAGPAFDTNISNLPDLLCTASGNQLCPPDIPLTASVDESGASDETPIPRMAAGPLTVGAGFAEARATEAGASALARGDELSFDPQGSSDAAAPARAADVLRETLRAVAPTWKAEADEDALVSATGVSATSELTVGPDAVAASSTSSVGGVALLEGLIRIEAVHSEASFEASDEEATGGPELTGVRVGPFEATIDEGGVHLADETIGAGVREALNAALEEVDALVRVRLGSLRTEPRPDGRRARSAALELSYEREIVPNTGAEVVHIDVGTAVASVARSETSVESAGVVGAPSAPPPSDPAEPALAAPSAPRTEPRTAPAPEPEHITQLPGPDTVPARDTLPGLPDFPVGMVVLVLGAAIAAGGGVTLLTGWQVAEE